ncbi:MAG TPA: NADPH:quinone reductase [Burkholderiales bacterium]|nr:NADPH:quinone reductase [Burkholderiales bacterium]
MRAIWYERTGAPHEVLVAGEMPAPQAGTGEVRLRLAASGVNPADCYRRRGDLPLEFPRVIPNSDGSGTVDQIGPGVSQDWLGRRVWLYNGQRGRAFGTAAEYIALDAGLVAQLPDNTPFDAGACLGIPCMTAHRCLFSDGPIANQTILVTGGAGAVGHYAVQLAKWAGARVIATVSSDTKAQQAAAAGADIVVNYHNEDVVARVLEATDGTGVDRIVEVDFGGNMEACVKAIRLNGTIAIYASRGNLEPKLPVSAFMRKNVTLRLMVLNTCPVDARRQAQRDIVCWIETGRAIHRIAARFSLERTAEAHAAVEKGGKLGTVVVEISPSA